MGKKKNVAKKANTNEWTVDDIDVVNECSKVPEKVVINFKPIVKQKIDILMDKYTNTEWLAYLIGDKENMFVEDLVFPKQKVSSAMVDDVEMPDYNDYNIIGVIHSHHSMGTFFSGTDDHWVNSNHDISIVASKQGNDVTFGVSVRVKTPCGAFRKAEGSVRILMDIEFDKDSFLKEVDEKLQRYTPPVTSYAGGYYNGYKEVFQGKNAENEIFTRHGVWVRDPNTGNSTFYTYKSYDKKKEEEEKEDELTLVEELERDLENGSWDSIDDKHSIEVFSKDDIEIGDIIEENFTGKLLTVNDIRDNVHYCIGVKEESFYYALNEIKRLVKDQETYEINEEDIEETIIE